MDDVFNMIFVLRLLLVPGVPPGGELQDRHSYAFDTTRLESQSLLKRLAQHRGPPGGPRLPT